MFATHSSVCVVKVFRCLRKDVGALPTLLSCCFPRHHSKIPLTTAAPLTKDWEAKQHLPPVGAGVAGDTQTYVTVVYLAVPTHVVVAGAPNQAASPLNTQWVKPLQ